MAGLVARGAGVLPCFDKLSMTGINPLALSQSKGAPPGRPLAVTPAPPATSPPTARLQRITTRA
ncbi:MAG: hypothetical protein E6K68_09720 [Nitrospirae bacterium]|nr:MAG: hypothetical protein E6K68_09720 [Nitrospirota bacterium]